MALRDLAKKYNGRAYVFGSYIKGENIGASDLENSSQIGELKYMF